MRCTVYLILPECEDVNDAKVYALAHTQASLRTSQTSSPMNMGCFYASPRKVSEQCLVHEGRTAVGAWSVGPVFSCTPNSPSSSLWWKADVGSPPVFCQTTLSASCSCFKSLAMGREPPAPATYCEQEFRDHSQARPQERRSSCCDPWPRVFHLM